MNRCWIAIRTYAGGAKNIEPKISATKRFDAHTWSIWATSMSNRGRAEYAVNMLKNVIEQKKVRRDEMVAIFNSAINICGHHGRFNEAWKIYNDMKKRAFEPVERTKASMLNALAESVERREGKCDKEEVWTYVQKIVGNDQLTRNLLGGMLKVCSRMESREHMEKIFRLDNIPPIADAVVFTNALSLISRVGTSGECYQLIQAMKERNIRPEPQNYVQLLMSCRWEISSVEGRWPSELKASYSAKVKEALDQCTPTMALLDVSLKLLMRMSDWKFAAEVVNKYVVPIVKDCDNIKSTKGKLDRVMLLMSLRVLSHDPTSSKPAFSFYELLVKKGYRPDAQDLEGLLVCCRQFHLHERAISYFSAACLKNNNPLTPTTFAVEYVANCLKKALKKDSNAFPDEVRRFQEKFPHVHIIKKKESKTALKE